MFSLRSTLALLDRLAAGGPCLQPACDQFVLRDGRRAFVHESPAPGDAATTGHGFVVTPRGRRRGRVIASASYRVIRGEPIAECSLEVAPEWRRLGIGSALVEALCRSARNAGLRDVRVKVGAASLSALELLESCGFDLRPCPDDPGWLLAWRTLPARQVSRQASRAGSRPALVAGWIRPSRELGALRSC